MGKKGYPTPTGIPAKKPMTMKAGKPEKTELLTKTKAASIPPIPSVRPVSMRNLMGWPGWKGK